MTFTEATQQALTNHQAMTRAAWDSKYIQLSVMYPERSIYWVLDERGRSSWHIHPEDALADDWGTVDLIVHEIRVPVNNEVEPKKFSFIRLWDSLDITWLSVAVSFTALALSALACLVI